MMERTKQGTWPQPRTTMTSQLGKVKTICVIGAGPAGLAVLKSILDTEEFKSGLWHPTAFEAREKVGGVWLPAEPVDDPPLTPLYDSLTTNLPHPVMAFTSYSFPPSTPVFPKARVVEDYLVSYSQHFGLDPYIQLGVSVVHVDYVEEKWQVRLSTGEEKAFDWVVVCNGHYRKPRFPKTPGLAEWLSRKKASHSAWYRRPHDLGSTVMVVGAGPSGQDISAEMCAYAHTVIHSVTGAVSSQTGNLKTRGRVVQFNIDNSVVFEDGTIDHGIDHCILATGYEMDFPFLSPNLLKAGHPPTTEPLPDDLYNSTYHVFPLAKHVFPLQSHFPPASLTFPGLLVRVAPFPLLEAQAAAIIHTYRHPLDVARETSSIYERYRMLSRQSTDPAFIAHAWHRFDGHEQFDYRDEMYRFAGRDVVVPEWEKEMYDAKVVLRKTWVALEKSGEADEWVRGVGEGGPHEWADLLKRLLKKGQARTDVSGDEAKI